MVVRAHFMGSFFDAAAGATLTSATVQVFQPGTVTNITATVFDKNGNPLTLPLTSDATTGLVDFYLTVAQEVDLQVSKTGFTTRTYSNVPVIDDSSFELTALLTTTGDTIYASAANIPARLGIGATGTILTNSGSSIPAWSNTIAAGGLTITAGGLTVSAGNMGVGGAALSSTAIAIPATAPALVGGGGATAYGVNSSIGCDSSTTTEFSAYVAAPRTAAVAFTCTTVADFHALNPTKGAGSTITNAYGLLVDAITSGNTNNYGISISAPSGGSGENYAIKTPHIVFTGSPPTTVSGQLALGNLRDALGGGATATLGTIGASGPTAAAQNSWLRVNANGSNFWLPVWA